MVHTPNPSSASRHSEAAQSENTPALNRSDAQRASEPASSAEQVSDAAEAGATETGFVANAGGDNGTLDINGFEVNQDTALIDVLRARDRGMDFRQVAALFSTGLEYYEAKGHNLYRRQLVGPSDAEVLVDYPREEGQRRMIMLASNNYLSLTTHPKVIAAAQEAARIYGTGSGSSPLLVGTTQPLRQLEEKLAEFKGYEAACVFSTGYSANVGIISAVAGKSDLIVIDRLAHASMVDGAKLSGARMRSFHHNDPEHLDRVLSRSRVEGMKLVVCESVYSMDGDTAPLDKIAEVCQRHGAMLLVDEAHSTGIYGPDGRGLVAEMGLHDQVDFIVGTMSKSLAACGGFVVGRSDYITYIRYFARSGMFSTAPPPMVCAAAGAAIDVVRSEPQLRERLWENIRYTYAALKRLGFHINDSPSPVIPVIVGTMGALRQMTLELHHNNVCVNSVPYPAVPHGGERLRISLTANLTLDQLERAVEAIEQAGKNAGVI